MANPTGFTPPTGGASLTDLLGTLKNVATAINGWTQQQQTLAGTQNLANITSATLVKAGAGRVVGLVVIVQDSTTGTIKLKATFPNRDLALWPGGFVNVKLKVETLHDALSIPPAAVQRGPSGL